LIQLRKDNDWLVTADFKLLETADKVFAYLRETSTKKYLVVMNFSNDEQDFTWENTVKKVLIANTEVTTALQNHKLQAWDAFCVEID